MFSALAIMATPVPPSTLAWRSGHSPDAQPKVGVSIASADLVRISGLTTERIEEGAIRIDSVLHDTDDGWCSIMNNTIVKCGKGIEVGSMPAVVSYGMTPPTRIYRYDTIENNLLYNCTDYAIKVGTGTSAAAWNPFDDAFGAGSGGNPLVPVRNNLVWNCGTTPMQGDDWYRTGITGDNRYGNFSSSVRQIKRPLGGGQYEVLGEEYQFTPSTFCPSVFVDATANPPDYRLYCDPENEDFEYGMNPAIGGGNPYRIDVLPGTEASANPKVMRRSIGAIPFQDPALDVYMPLVTGGN